MRLPSLSLCFLAALALAVPLSGCGGGGGGGGSSASAPAAPSITAPNSIPAGVVMSFGGLTLTFTGGTSISYANASNADFTASLSSGIAVYSSIDPGTSPLASFLVGGVGAGEPGKLLSGNGTETMQLTFSRMENGILKEAVVTIGGKTYTATFSGTPLPKGTSVSSTTTPPATADQVPVAAQGSYSFVFGVDRGVSGCPWTAGQAASVTLGANSMTINGKTLPFSHEIVERGYHLYFKDGALTYSVEGTGEIYSGLYGKVTYIIVSYNGAYAGQLSYTNPVNTTNDAGHSIVGKRFFMVCVSSPESIDGKTPAFKSDLVGATAVIEVGSEAGYLTFNALSGTAVPNGHASYDGISSVGTGQGAYAGVGTLDFTASYDLTAKTLKRLSVKITTDSDGKTYDYVYEAIGQQ